MRHDESTDHQGRGCEPTAPASDPDVTGNAPAELMVLGFLYDATLALSTCPPGPRFDEMGETLCRLAALCANYALEVEAEEAVVSGVLTAAVPNVAATVAPAVAVPAATAGPTQPPGSSGRVFRARLLATSAQDAWNLIRIKSLEAAPGSMHPRWRSLYEAAGMGSMFCATDAGALAGGAMPPGPGAPVQRR